MSDTSLRQVLNAISAINDWANFDAAKLIDWRAYDDGLAINVEESGFEAYTISTDATIHGALPKGTFLEPINNCSLRLVKA